MSATHGHSLEFSQAGKPLRRSTATHHLSVGPGSEGNLLAKGDGHNNELHSYVSNKRSAGNEHKLEKLKEENVRLKLQLEDLRIQYEQLIEEGKCECFDERRVNLLKAQVMQLERQVMLLTEGLSSRASLLLELDNALQPVLDKLRCLVATESRLSEVPVTRAELIRMIEICQAMRAKLHRNHQETSVENLALPWLLSGRQATKKPVTLVDLCFGKMENLNLQYVSALEGKLSTLFRHLHATRQTLSLILAPGPESLELAHHILPNVIYARLINHLTRCNQSLEECCRDLLTLTLIVPSAPWVHALEAELDFHRSIYSLQIQYTEALFQGIKQAYHNFQENVAAVVCSPLKDVLSSYADLKAEASEASLRNYLTVFKNNVEQIQDAVDTLTPSKNQQHEGDEALSKLGKEFFLSLEHSLKNCGEQRDKSACEIEKLKKELDQSLESLNNLKKERKEKGRLSRGYSTRSEAVTIEGTVPSSFDQGQQISEITPQHFGYRSPNSQSFSSGKEREISDNQSLPQKQSSGSARNQRNKSLQRSNSVKKTLRPPWQD
ncbi:uncharacterized protein LOC142491099 isoform X2 [Ascaphus truei]|uniref:uncharacterized protein LOC142491099 isoform X2 n=1 Tax=Ascaphus truei TaxID=8439 RepID=UPI003F5AA3B6